MKLLINEKNDWLTSIFDISLFFYLVAYYVYFQNITNYASYFRILSTFFLFACGFLICLKKRITIDYYLASYSLFVIFGFLSMIWAKDSSLIISIMPSLIRNIIFLFFVSMRIETKDDIEKIFKIHIFVIIFLNLFIMNLMVSFYSFPELLTKRFGDNFGFNSNATSFLNAVSALICFYFIKKDKSKILYSIVFVFMLFIIVICESKQGIISLIFGISLMYYLRGGSKKRLKIIIVMFCFLLMIWELMMNNPKLYQIIGYRFENFLGLFNAGIEDGSTINRNNLLIQAFDVWIKNPILGVGFNNFPILQTVQTGYYYAHNNYLELLADTGIFGFSLYYINYIRINKFSINKKDSLQVFLKSLFFMLVIVDFTVVSFQDLRHQLPLYLVFIGLSKFNSIKRNKGETK